ncbi:hypothetical protein C8J56DRAFT_1063152 [Mycena floridula]|nr:hypothetical protein C8J56DRAFT_1063152 [Mycena floridula]
MFINTNPQRVARHLQKPAKVLMACSACRKRKVKCENDSKNPMNPCQRCQRLQIACQYISVAEETDSSTSDPSARGTTQYQHQGTSRPTANYQQHSGAGTSAANYQDLTTQYNAGHYVGQSQPHDISQATQFYGASASTSMPNTGQGYTQYSNRHQGGQSYAQSGTAPMSYYQTHMPVGQPYNPTSQVPSYQPQFSPWNGQGATQAGIYPQPGTYDPGSHFANQTGSYFNNQDYNSYNMQFQVSIMCDMSEMALHM